VSTPTNSAPSSAAKVILGCSKCGSSLPDGAQFCLQCGKPIAVLPKEPEDVGELTPELVQPRRKPRIFLWILVALLVSLIVWIAMSDGPFAQGLQEMAGWKHDQPILETPFTVSAHNFRFYKFTLPEGSTNVSIVGQFTAAAESKATKQKEKADNDIEVYVLSEPAFAVWQNGYATSAVYESGRVSKGRLQADLPAGAGVYYLIFSNKFAAHDTKDVNATVLLRYKSWLPDWFRSMRERFRDWVGN